MFNATMPPWAIDMHCHCNSNSKYDTKPQFDPKNTVSNVFPAFLEKERRRMNVLGCALTTYSAVLSSEEVYEQNEYMYALSKENPFFFQWAVIDPCDERTFEQAKRMLKSDKTLGLKIHSYFHNYEIMNEVRRLFAFANDLGAALLMHPDHPREVCPIADEFPDMKLINAHLSGLDHIHVIQNAKHGNVFTDTSGSLSYQNNVIEYAVERIGSEKIFFGTDSYSCAFQRGRIDYADVSDQDKENILRENALREFPKLKKAFSDKL